MIGNTVTPKTRDCSREAPLAGGLTLTCRSSSIPLELPLGLMCVRTFRPMIGYGEGTDAQQTSSVIPGDGLWYKTTVDDVLDTVGGRLCYVYA